jgi:hypothetical protein
MLFRPAKPARRDILPWWHPWSLMRAGWNLVFSLALGAALGAITVELLAQVIATLSGGDWREWLDRLELLGWAIGCFVAFVAYMSYRMDEKTES